MTTTSGDESHEELESDEEMCAYEKLRMRNIAERKKKFEEYKLTNLVSEASAHLKKKKAITKPINVGCGTDDAFECNAKPSTSRSLPSRSCKTKINYDEIGDIMEPNFSDGKNCIQSEDEYQPEL